MMAAEYWLMATAACVILGGIATLIAFQFGRRRLSFLLATVETLAGFAGATVLAVMLSQSADSGPFVVSSPIWNWFSFSGPRALAIGFGLEATGIKAGLIGLIGLIAFIVLVSGYHRKQYPLSDQVILAISLLYAGGVIFMFAPNLAQALLGWAAISLLSGILIRLAKSRAPSERIDTQGRSASSIESPATKIFDRIPDHRPNRITASLDVLERFFVQRIWRALTIRLPASIAEQLESVEGTSLSFQLAATVLCAFAVLLTWLMVSV